MTDRGCERSCRLVTLRRDESDFQPSSRAAAVATSAPPAVPRIGETFQSGLHERSIPCIIREEELQEFFIAVLSSRILSALIKTVFCLRKTTKILILALHCIVYNRYA